MVRADRLCLSESIRIVLGRSGGWARAGLRYVDGSNVRHHPYVENGGGCPTSAPVRQIEGLHKGRMAGSS